jgi:tetrahydromethanopterin S-methyltransferase subunit E
MTAPNQDQTGAKPSTREQTTGTGSKTTPLRCFISAIIAGAIAYMLYNATASVAGTFALHQVQSNNFIIMRLSAAIRTLVIGLFAMATGVFSVAGLGLSGLGIQLLIQPKAELPSD